MSNRILRPAKLAGAALVLAIALLITFRAPAPVQAATKLCFIFDQSDVSSVKVTSKKVKFLGSPYNAASYNRLARGWYTYKITGKTKFRQLVDTMTGKDKKVKKSTALKKLKKKKFIAVYVTFTRTGKATKIVFGV